MGTSAGLRRRSAKTGPPICESTQTCATSRRTERVHFSHYFQGSLGLRELRGDSLVFLPQPLVLGVGRALRGAAGLLLRGGPGCRAVAFPAPFRQVSTVDSLAAQQGVPFLRGRRALVLPEDAHLVLAGERPALRPRCPRPVWAGHVPILPVPRRDHVSG